MTREGRVKQKVKRALKEYGHCVYSHWPVLNGMGAPELDCNIIVNGYAVSVETKAPGFALTPRQRETALAKIEAGGIVLVIKDDDDIRSLVLVLDALIVGKHDLARAIMTENLACNQIEVESGNWATS